MTWKEEKEKLGKEILGLLYANRMIRTFYRDKPEGWTLMSGLYSPLYIQLRPLASFPELFTKVCSAVSRMMAEESPQVNRVIGIAMAGVPIAAGVSIVGGIPAGFTRKLENVKTLSALRETITSYGEHSLLEGEISDGDEIALVDDLVTRFDSKLIAREQVKHEIARRSLKDVRCETVVVVLDREQGGGEAAQAAGLKLLSLIPFKTLGLFFLKDFMQKEEWDVISRYLDDPSKFQDTGVRQELADLARRAH